VILETCPSLDHLKMRTDNKWQKVWMKTIDKVDFVPMALHRYNS
jgi:hypothetical protein